MRAETKFILAMPKCCANESKRSSLILPSAANIQLKCCANESKRSSLILPSAANIQLVSAANIRQSQMGIK
mgnify:CR=1 FL=1